MWLCLGLTVSIARAQDMNTLLNFAHALEDETSGDQSLSLRQLLRLTRHYGKYPADLLDHLSASLLLRHLPAGRRQIVESVVRKQLRPLLGAKGGTATGSSSGTGIVEGKGYLTINGIRHPINKPKKYAVNVVKLCRRCGLLHSRVCCCCCCSAPSWFRTFTLWTLPITSMSWQTC